MNKEDEEEKRKAREAQKAERKRKEEERQQQPPLNFYQPSDGSSENLQRDQNDNDANIDSGEIIFQNTSKQGHTSSASAAETS